MKYKYIRKDFTAYPATLKHMDLSLKFIDDRVEVENVLTIMALEDSNVITLNAEELDIKSVSIGDSKADYSYDEKKCLLKINRAVKKNEKITIHTKTICHPSDTHLEGIYKDTGPKNAPQQYMSQCEMWGFQRIAPVIDDPRAKCTMTTIMEADARYSHIISNGDICRKTCPDGKPIIKGDRKIVKYINNIPMPPYLFIAAAGTWDEVADSITYDNGRSVQLVYLVPPGTGEQVKIPMEILKKSVLWIKKEHDYEYTREVYRTITMNKSDAGGMENVGNTTIITDAALINDHTLDGYLLYAYAVIVHEFEHNQCGSETTMETPFDIWLNEAYTVEVERDFIAEQFNAAWMRLSKVDSIRDPVLGPLAIEDAGYHGQIRREGFNDPRELIDGVTYVKAAEVMRMLQLIMGKENFKKAKTLYFSRYKDKNANTEQFFKCFEEVYGESLAQFKKEWLLRIGYPNVEATTSYDKATRTINLRFEQLQDGNAFHLPIELALVDQDGKDYSAKTFVMKDKKAKLLIENVDEPAFVSMNRDYSFYGTFVSDLTTNQLRMQARLDPNLFNRVEAMKQLTDIERTRILEDPKATPSVFWLELYDSILDSEMNPAIKARLLTIAGKPLNRKYMYWYEELPVVKDMLMLALNNRYKDKLVSLFNSINTYTNGRLEQGIENRSLKAALLGLIAIDDKPESHELILKHYEKATTATDRVTALVHLNRSSCGKRREILDSVYKKWHDDLSGYANYLRIIASGNHDSIFEESEVEKNRPGFDIKQPTFARALIFPMAFNNKVIWNDKGLEWVKNTILELTEINNNLAARLLNTFQHYKFLKTGLQKKVGKHLQTILDSVTQEDNPTIYGQAKAYLGK